MGVFLSFFFLILTIFSMISITYGQELTEEQKKQLQQAIQEKLERIKKDVEKINKLSEIQNQPTKPEDSENLSRQKESQKPTTDQEQKPVVPRWDGIYILDKDNNYKELKTIANVSVRQNTAAITGEKYFSVYVLPKDINYVSFDDLKGFFLKGRNITERVYLYLARMDTTFLKGITSFLSGMPGGQGFNIKSLNNLYATELRCETESNSQYCEFINAEKFRNYLSKDNYCLFFITGTSPEKGGKSCIICFNKSQN